MNRSANIFFGFLFLLANFSLQAQTIPAPHLKCASVLPNGDVQLTWSDPTVVCGPFVSYNIYFSSNYNGPYNLLGSAVPQNQTTFTHFGANGNVVTYWYYVVCDYSCFGYTPINSDTISNDQPAAPILAFVGVVGSVKNEIYWYPSTSIQTAGYIIYIEQNGQFIPFDTVWGYIYWGYIDSISGATADTGEVTYSVAAFDSCFNLGPFWQPAQHTIFQTVSTPGPCDDVIHIHWTQYDGWFGGIYPGGVGEYHIGLYGDNTPFQYVVDVNGDQFDYDYLNIHHYDTLCFTIAGTAAISGWISRGNMVCIGANPVHGAHDFYIHNVTVNAANNVDITYTINADAELQKILVQRSTDGFFFSQIDDIPPPANLNILNSYTDLTAQTGATSYYYRFIAVDNCGRKDTSSMGKSIWLSGFSFTDGTNDIAWDDSKIDYATVSQYELFKDVSGIYGSLSIVTPPAPHAYEETTQEDSSCYVVEATFNLSLPYSSTETLVSRSNELCLVPPTQVYFPNAFAPEGKNNIFMPLFDIHTSIAVYDFKIFNRWGAEIFNTNSPEVGWNGTYKGKVVEQGAYAYSMTLVDAIGSKLERNGMVLLLR